MINELYFRSESFVASCKTIEGASKLVRFMQERFITGRSTYRVPYKFLTVIETNEKISVHCNYCFDDRVRQEFKAAIAEFLHAHSQNTVPAAA